MNFSRALHELKTGKKASRSGWNGKGLHVEVCNQTELNGVAIKPFFVIKGIDGSCSIWVPSVGDIFAEDWDVVSDEVTA